MICEELGRMDNATVYMEYPPYFKFFKNAYFNY